MDLKKLSLFLLPLLMLGSCTSDFFKETEIPGLAGVWGSISYSCSSYQTDSYNPVLEKWEVIDHPAVEFSILPTQPTYTMFKFEGDEIWLMKESPFIDAPAGVAFPCVIDGDMVHSEMFPSSYATEIYKVTDLTKDTFKLIHIQQGESMSGNGSSIHGYKAVITFQRLK